MKQPLATHVLYSDYTNQISYFDDWLDAFRSESSLDVDSFDIHKMADRRRLAATLSEADLVVLLHSTNGDSVIDLGKVAPILKGRNCPLVSFVGNEVNIPGSPIAEKRRILDLIEPDYIASQLTIDAAQFLWGDIARERVLSIPHALNPDAFRAATPIEQRPITVGVRGAFYSPLLGDTDRNDLYRTFVRLGTEGRVIVDMSDTKLTREEWADFLNTCRATVSSESGSWFLERDDKTMNMAMEWAKEFRRPRFSVARRGTIERVWRALPAALRTWLSIRLDPATIATPDQILRRVDDDEILAMFFSEREPPSFYGKCISSRHFDAIGTGTIQVLLEGRYNDCLEPGTHYLQLRQGYSNLDEVLDSLQDLDFCRKISEQALSHVLNNHTYAHRVRRMVSEILSCT